jgi:glutamine amidotransferase
MKKVAIVDYGMGNIDSIVRAIEETGVSPIVTNKREDFADAGSIILPGVGAFADGMFNIRAYGLDEVLKEEVIKKKTPILGICLGMQLFAKKGFEGGEVEGLGWIEGEVRKLQSIEPNTKIPHIGWNEINLVRNSLLVEGIPEKKDFYFAHSYHLVCKNDIDVVAWTPYCGRFVSIIANENIFGVQFHPEKSQRFGLQLLRNFVAL